jgi:hypothetical protein
LRGVYHDVNEKHLPSQQLAALAEALPMRDEADKGRREAALAATAIGAALLAALPVLLAIAGSSWHAATRSTAPGHAARKPQFQLSETH